MTTSKSTTRARPQTTKPRQDGRRRPEDKTAKSEKPRDDDMPGADGFRSARADEDTYD